VSPRRKKDKAPKPEKAPKARRVKKDRPPRQALFSRFRRKPAPEPGALSTEALLVGYRRPGLSQRKSVALYVILAAICIGWGFMFGLAAPFKLMPLLAPLPFLALLLVWALPQGEYAPVRALEPLYLAFFAALVIWPNYLAVTIPGLPWLTLLRIFGAPLILVLLVCISVSANFRKALGDPLRSDPHIWKMMLGFVAIQTFSLLLTDRLGIAINKYLVAQLNHTAIFVVSCYLFTLPTFATRWAGGYIAMAYVVCLVGVWQQLLGQLPWVGHIPPLLKVDNALIDNVLDGIARSAIGVNRVQSIATSPLGLAELLGLAAPFAIHFAVARGHLAVRVLSALYLPLALYVILLSDSRLGIVVLMGAVLFYVLIWSALRWTSDRRSLLGPALVLAYPAVLMGTLIASFFIGALRRAVWGGGAEASSTASRFTQWEMAKPKLFTHPWGFGIGEAAREVGFRSPNGQTTLDSYYILLLMDYGFLGFILYMAIFIRASWIAGASVVKYRPNGDLAILLPIAVALMNFVVAKMVFVLEANHPLIFMMLGGALAMAWRLKNQAAAEAGGVPARA
jgi:hypothetical protein